MRVLGLSVEMYYRPYSFVTRLLLLLNTVGLVSDLEDSLRRVEVILIQQPGLTANVKDIQHQIKVLQVYRVQIEPSFQKRPNQ